MAAPLAPPMVRISPFRALRYDPARAGDLSALLAPPYDVIGAEERERLYARSPHNIVRLILGRELASDSEGDNRYTRARRDFDAWCAAGILRRDPAPALYLTEHRYADEDGRSRTRLGVTALLRLDDGAADHVLRHEATLSAPRADRARLLAAVPANLSPIFCIYPDPEGIVQAAWERAARTSAQATARLNGEDLRLWPVTDAPSIEALAGHLAGTPVLIADGHHRFEVAAAERARYPAVMAHFVSMADPGLLMRPIHRLGLPPQRLEPRALEGLCTLEAADGAETLLPWLAQAGAAGRFGWYDGERLMRVQVKPAVLDAWLQAPSVAAPLAGLGVSILHDLLLARLCVAPSAIRYTAQPRAALEAVRRGEAAWAWLMPPIALPDVFALARQGLTMPPKSTYFYPKVPSGLTLNPLTESR